jgi:two-component system, OmpR family, alkaline phosphatase synthesis response regulator PhoP
LKTILVIEDDEEIIGLLRFNLENHGYRVMTADEGKKGLDFAKKLKPDLILLDIMLPGIDGYEVCRSLRAHEGMENIPIIMITARSEELDVVLGLELGADDYVTKPFSIRELLSRIKVQLRSKENKEPKADETETITVRDITLKPEEYKVYLREKPLFLTHKEYELLKLFMINKGKVLKRDLLLEKIWGYDTDIDTRTVDVHIRYLRQKIEDDPSQPSYIETIRGVGYTLRP